MNEFMGLVFGAYDAKAEGFVPGGASLHNCMAGHGPDAETFERASDAELKPQYVDNTLAFMFETQLVVRPTEFAMKTRILQHEYFECWQGLKSHFSVGNEERKALNEEMSVIANLLDGLFDYAGLFPPASLDLPVGCPQLSLLSAGSACRRAGTADCRSQSRARVESGRGRAPEGDPAQFSCFVGTGSGWPALSSGCWIAN